MLHALITFATEEAGEESSKTVFYICGGALAVWALVVSAIGIKAHETLFRISGAIEADLNKANRPGPAEVQCCFNGGLICAGDASWGPGYALQRSEACERAALAAGNGCWNQYCVGCCAFSECNAFCGGSVVGRS